MLFLSLTILVGLHGFEILDQTDLEWVASGYQIEETVINPYDYVQSIGETTPSVACYAFFPNPEEDIWRIIIVGKEKMVVLQEDWESPFELNVPFDAVGAVFSRSGKYVIIRECNSINDQAIRVNIETGEVTYFDPTPDNIRCGLLLADDGEVTGVGYDFFISFNSALQLFECEIFEGYTFQRTGFSAGSKIILRESVVDQHREIMAFDWDGNPLWMINTDDKPVVSPIAVSMDGSLVAVTFASDGFMLIDGATGEILSEQFPGCQSSYVSFSEDGSHIAFPTALQIGDPPYNMILTYTEELNRSGISQQYLANEGYYYSPSDVSNTGYCLFAIFRSGISNYSRLGLTGNDGLIWCSRVMHGLDRVYSISPNYFNIDINLRSLLQIIAPGGSSFIYMDAETGNIHINSIERRFQ